MRTKYVGLLAVAGVAGLPALAQAAGPSLSDILVNSGITAAGYVSGSYDATFNSTANATFAKVPLHAFDTNSNTFELNQAALTLSYLPTSGFGALVNVITGEDAKVINGSYGAGSSGDFALTQGYIQYAEGNLTVIGGRFVTLAGNEVIDDSKNTNISRSLLFTNLEPLVHTGVRASYKVNDMFTGTVGVNNSALSGASQDTDKHKTIELGGALTPSSTISVAVADYLGLDGTKPNSKNNYLDLVASWQATTALQLVVNGDYVRSIGSLDTVPSGLVAGSPISTSDLGSSNGEGVALYVNDQILDSLKGSLRAEYTYFKASDTTFGGTGSAHVSEVTATLDYSAAKNFDLLGEVRGDYSSRSAAGITEGVFPDSNNLPPSPTAGFQKGQEEVLVKAIYKFGTPTGS